MEGLVSKKDQNEKYRLKISPKIRFSFDFEPFEVVGEVLWGRRSDYRKKQLKNYVPSREVK